MITALLRPSAATKQTGGSLADPQNWVSNMFSGGPTKAGPAVNEDQALTFAAVFNAVTILSNALKVLPLVVYERADNDAKRPAIEHPVYVVLHRRANPEMPASRFRAYIQACKLLWGNGLAEIERNRGQEIIGLWPIHPSRVIVTRDGDGEIVYRVRNGDGTYVEIPRQRMFHVMGYSRDGMWGQSVVGLARESLGLSMAAEQYGATFFGNGAEPGGVLQHPGTLSDVARANIKASWQTEHGGASRHHPAILEEGMQWQSVGMPNDDIQFLETRQFQVTEVARWFDLPPHMLKDLTKATFSNIEHQALEYVTQHLSPHLVDVEDEASIKLFSESEQGRYFAEFNVRAFLRGDHKSRSEYYKAMWEIGAYSINDILRLENMNPIGPAGDAHFVQMNMTTVERAVAGEGSATRTQPGAADAEWVKAAMMPVFTYEMSRLCKKEANAVARAAGKYAGDEAAFVRWLEKFYAEHEAAIVEAMQAGSYVLLALLGPGVRPAATAALRHWARTQAAASRSAAATAFAAGGVEGFCDQRRSDPDVGELVALTDCIARVCDESADG